MMRFRDRVDAGRQLAAVLQRFKSDDVVVYALPRGGVTLGAEVAKALSAPLDVVIARKIGHPYNPEYAICALSEHGHLVCNEAERASVDAQWFEQAVSRERNEAARRRQAYCGGRPSLSPEGKTAILVDDGIATGLTMRAAIADVKARNPKRLVVAIPVIPPETAIILQQEVDEVVALDIPDLFLGAVGAYYDDFTQVTDEEVIRLLQTDPAYLFTLPPYEDFTDALLRDTQAVEGAYTLGRFPNDELYARVPTDMQSNTGLVLGAITPPEEQMVRALLLSDTLKREGARNVIFLAPYLAYMRQDRREPGYSLATAWVARLLHTSGVDEVVTVDIHSQDDHEFFPMPLVSLSPAPLFAEVVRDLTWADATLVAPDEGAIPRCQAVREATGVDYPIARFSKVRSAEGVRSTLQDRVNSRAIVIDDILDTGGTLIACCDSLRATGVERIVIMITHGLFTGKEWMRLWSLGVDRIYCTDTVPLREDMASDRVQILTVRPLLARYIVEKIA